MRRVIVDSGQLVDPGGDIGGSVRVLRRETPSPKSSRSPTGGSPRASLPVAGRRSMLARWRTVRSMQATFAPAKDAS